MRSTTSRLLLLVTLLLVAGCRTYGSYNATEKLLLQIQETNQLFAEQLLRARTDFVQLEQAAQRNPVLDPVALTYASAIALHEEALGRHLAYEAEARANPGSHRTQHRVYGAITAEQNIVYDRYAFALRLPLQQDSVSVQKGSSGSSRYQVAPPFYKREAIPGPTMGEIIGRAEVAAAAAAEAAREATP